MQRVRLIRSKTSKRGTKGRFYVDGLDKEIDSLELPWRNNLPWRSCVPAGVYCVVHERDQMRLIGGTVGAWQTQPPLVTRCGILIHPANTINELSGCIALGLWLNAEGVYFVHSSHDCFRALEAATETPFELVISWLE